jgi:hypothetical protein
VSYLKTFDYVVLSDDGLEGRFSLRHQAVDHAARLMGAGVPNVRIRIDVVRSLLVHS